MKLTGAVLIRVVRERLSVETVLPLALAMPPADLAWELTRVIDALPSAASFVRQLVEALADDGTWLERYYAARSTTVVGKDGNHDYLLLQWLANWADLFPNERTVDDMLDDLDLRNDVRGG